MKKNECVREEISRKRYKSVQMRTNLHKCVQICTIVYRYIQIYTDVCKYVKYGHIVSIKWHLVSHLFNVRFKEPSSSYRTKMSDMRNRVRFKELRFNFWFSVQCLNNVFSMILFNLYTNNINIYNCLQMYTIVYKSLRMCTKINKSVQTYTNIYKFV